MNDTDHRCKIVYRTENDDLAMVLRATSPEGGRVAFCLARQSIPHGGVSPIIELPGDEMRKLLQSIVDEAAKFGIAASDSASTLRAKDDNLGDLRKIVTALLARPI